ncbi:flagellar basal body P-ring formation chaperone FlgA [Natranaerovirga hydrolytica]|uniref:Flagellar basal body P-ring formation chaperone FlgA n=1 Tax=Natranaerovirga hydrolytica TaxID=680378 RepID=A0A4R1N2N8_9FIRM|nr:SAF domain-containing protein [Natranaerovirga hydrolytica]TCK99711.1 flagellar basal body P-ring formation chaperone FlgA [Natranaerovirga hydrolytica]
MSIIRQRTKNLLVAGFVGALIMASIGMAIFTFMHIEMKALKIEISNMESIEVEEPIPRKDMYVFNQLIEAGDVIGEGDIMMVSAEEGLIPQNAITNKEEIVGKSTKLSVTTNMPVISDLLFTAEDIRDDLRIQEYSLFFLPSRLKTNDVIDIRITFPNGEDFIVLSKKQVKSIEKTEENNTVLETLWLHLSEEELLRISSAIVDAYLNEGSRLYGISYVMPEVQEAAKVNYPVNQAVYNLIKENPNIVDIAMEELEMNKRKTLEQNLSTFMDSEGEIISAAKPSSEEVDGGRLD